MIGPRVFEKPRDEEKTEKLAEKCWLFNQGKYLDEKRVLAPCYYCTTSFIEREMAGMRTLSKLVS